MVHTYIHFPCHFINFLQHNIPNSIYKKTKEKKTNFKINWLYLVVQILYVKEFNSKIKIFNKKNVGKHLKCLLFNAYLSTFFIICNR